MMKQARNFYISEIACKALVLLLAILVYSLVTPYERHIAWNEADRHRPVLEESVPAWAAFTINGVVTGAYLIFVLVSITIHAKKKSASRTNVMNQVAQVVLSLVSAVAYTWAIVEPLKRFVSEPRPHFLARCYGGVDRVPQLNDIPTQLTNEFCIQNYADLGRLDEISDKIMNEDRLSFPSAHSAFTASIFFWMGLSVYYYSHLLNVPGYTSAGSSILILLSCPLFFVATSRIRDLWHFPHDVFGGLLIGSVISAWQYFSYFPFISQGSTGAKAFFGADLFSSSNYSTFRSSDVRSVAEIPEERTDQATISQEAISNRKSNELV